jgi:hypothetical protein
MRKETCETWLELADSDLETITAGKKQKGGDAAPTAGCSGPSCGARPTCAGSRCG